ncbi:hypothetical protein K501DRAFT_271581 [Backusella circina FSU 941]|nr:hypothetical protein K501DRAFT_271581 [Backusella circina FSU 941]
MLLSKFSGYNHAKRIFSPCLYRIIQTQNMSIDVIPTHKKTTEIPSFNLLDTSINNHLKPQGFQLLNKDQSKLLTKIQSYELNSQYNPQIIISKYSKKNEDEEEISHNTVADMLLTDKQRYQLIHYIATLQTPYVSIIDTDISGFNACTSIVGGFKVVTENTKVQLASSLFSFSGLATHYVHSSKLTELEKTLEELKAFDAQSVNQVLNRFSVEYVDNNEIPFGGYRRTIIDSCFSYDNIDEILEALQSNGSAFALKVHHVINNNYHMASMCLDDIRNARTSLGFSDYLTTKHKQDLLFLNDNDFSCLRHSYLLPFERDVKKFIEDKLFFSGNEDAILQHFADLFNNKYGVREKVKDIIERKTKKVQVGDVSKLVWCD